MDIWSIVRRAVADALPGIAAEDVRIPARHAACSVYAPALTTVRAETFADMLGVRAVCGVEHINGWLLLAFTDAFYDACVRRTIEALPPPNGDLGSAALNRMLLLSRQGGCGCPQNESVQRALWLLIGAAYGQLPADEAARAFAGMLRALPVQARMEMRRTCGAMADASARLYARALTAAQNEI